MSDSMGPDQMWAPPPAAPEPPVRRGNAWLWPVALIVIALLLVGGGITAVLLLRGGTQPAPLAATSAAPVVADSAPVSDPAITPAPQVTLSGKAACVQLIPELTTTAKLINEVADQPDGSTVNQGKLDSTVTDLQGLIPELPAGMQADANVQLDTLTQLQAIFQGTGDPTLDLESFKSSGLELATGCAKYAR